MFKSTYSKCEPGHNSRVLWFNMLTGECLSCRLSYRLSDSLCSVYIYQDKNTFIVMYSKTEVLFSYPQIKTLHINSRIKVANN